MIENYLPHRPPFLFINLKLQDTSINFEQEGVYGDFLVNIVYGVLKNA